MNMKNKTMQITLGALILTALVMPPADAGSCSAKQASDVATADIVETAIGAGSFDTLVAAVKAAGLVDALSGDGPLTVFAPTDEAFAKLPAGTVETLLQPENKEMLVSILTYHVTPGRLTATDVTSAKRLETLNGNQLTVSMGNDSVRIGNANITATDILTSNGVIHVIDSVLLPESSDTRASSAAMQLIRLAINRGAPLYNDGQPQACAAVYEVTAWSLANADSYGLDAHARDRLEQALAIADRTHDSSRQAWILREALDDVASSLDTMKSADSTM